METSRYFERTLFFDRSPAADEYYVRASGLVFEDDASNSKIEVRVQSASNVSTCGKSKAVLVTDIKDRMEGEREETLKHPNGNPASSNKLTPNSFSNSSSGAYDAKVKLYDEEKTTTAENFSDSSDDEGDSWSLSSTASSTALPAALDQNPGGSGPPMYPGLPKLNVIDLDLGSLQNFVKRTKHDFRVFYIRQRHSFSRIQITKEIFEQLVKSCHVFPRFNEFLIGFGSKHSESEVGPPPLKFRPLFSAQNDSYRGFECAYILRYVEFTNRGRNRDPFSLRQFAIYHRYKPVPQNRCSTWILVGASQRTENRLDHYTRSIDNLKESNPFELHVIFIDTAIASWRPYLVHLSEQVTFQSGKALGIEIGSPGADDDFLSIEVEDHQQLKQIEDEIADLMLCLDSTSDTVSTLMEMYEQFHQNRPDSQGSPDNIAHGSDHVSFALKDKTKEIAYTRKKAEALLSKVQNTRTLISSLLDRQSGNNIDEQISALNKLEKQGQDENVIMRQLAEKNSRDSSSMRILTIITMIYLPCTIVSNFYSTQFVSQKELSSGDTRLEYAQNAWLFFAISVPLTLVTIFVWYLWVNSEKLFGLFRRGQDNGEKQSSYGTRVLGLRRSSTGLPLWTRKG